MRQIVYISTASAEFAEGDLFKIIATSAKNNGRSGLSGFLLYSDRRFLQLLEGPAQKLDALYRIIEKDPQHCGCTILLDRLLTKASFDQWSMKRVPASGGKSAALTFIAENTNAPLAPEIASLIDGFFDPASKSDAAQGALAHLPAIALRRGPSQMSERRAKCAPHWTEDGP